MAPRTLYDKIWDDHVVETAPDGNSLLYIDRHLVHEVTSPQAFEGLRVSGRTVHSPQRTLAVVDHNVPTSDRSKGIDDPESAMQVETLANNARDFGVEYYSERDTRQGIVHIVGPEQGFTLPGTTIVKPAPDSVMLLCNNVRFTLHDAALHESTNWRDAPTSSRWTSSCARSTTSFGTVTSSAPRTTAPRFSTSTAISCTR